MIRSMKTALLAALIIGGSAMAALQLTTPVENVKPVSHQSIEQYLQQNDNTLPGFVELPDVIVHAE